jgi:chromate transporter
MLLSVRQQATAQADFCSAGADEHALAFLRVFLKLGLTSFGGSVAHVGYFRDEFVGRRKWLDDTAFADLVALRPVRRAARSDWRSGFRRQVTRAPWRHGLASACLRRAPWCCLPTAWARSAMP